ncbi:hypothetical protein GCM10009069_11850 [Algimonas arctica]|uniref:Glycosyltransferase n=1 Tax=Algimonas arctica TaxID=1479486 RepID=A0A8J3CQ51_9PROT|nr:hypothetical protein [Algimonas arctica]GHA90532.1 hypothetical protein GCM10009069_11850 [Algimonas arctica]
MQTVICMKWGTRYGPEFVNRMWAAVQRNTARPTRLVCLTDDVTGIDAAVHCHPIPDINLPLDLINTPWRKLTLWQAPLADLSGDVLFLDLDLVITGSLDEMFDFEPGRYCVIENWTQMGQGNGNTSAFRFPVGKYTHIFNDLQDNPNDILSRYRIEQLYISREIDDMVFWPTLWCASFKHTLLPRWPMNFVKAPDLPAETRIVAFTGKPDQDEALRGEWPVKAAWKKLYKHVRPTPWIAEHW